MPRWRQKFQDKRGSDAFRQAYHALRAHSSIITDLTKEYSVAMRGRPHEFNYTTFRAALNDLADDGRAGPLYQRRGLYIGERMLVWDGKSVYFSLAYEENGDYLVTLEHRVEGDDAGSPGMAGGGWEVVPVIE